MKPLKKPLLRGYFHQECFYIALGACLMLVAKSTHSVTLVASVVYSVGLLAMFGVSAVYHRIHWQPKQRAILRRLDHSSIFILIAATFTPICLLALPYEVGQKLLLGIWILGCIGIFQSVFWVHAPKWLTALFYIGMGWYMFPYFTELKASLGVKNFFLIFAGGLAYTAGAVVYAVKKPNFKPEVFGYHEVFHVLTIVGALLHFLVIYSLIV